MNLRRLLPAVFALVACQLIVPAAHAVPRRYGAPGFREGYEFTVSLNFTSFENKMELNDESGAGVRFGYLFNPNHEIEFLYNGVTADDASFIGETAKIANMQVAYVYNFTAHGVVPYFTAGLGWVRFDDSSPFLGSETDQVLGLGGGVRLFLGRVAYARFEVRGNFFEGDDRVFASGESFTFTETSFGFGWRFPVR